MFAMRVEGRGMISRSGQVRPKALKQVTVASSVIFHINE